MLPSFNNRFNNIFDLMSDDRFDDMFSSDLSQFKVDIKDKEDEYEVEAELPGFNKEDISASLKDHYLEIVATKNVNNDSNDNYLYQERSTTTVKRTFYLADAINEKVSAKLDNGILKLVIPKRKVATEHHIEIE
jgi:HSP20 family protein